MIRVTLGMILELLYCLQAPLEKWQNQPEPESAVVRRQIDRVAERLKQHGISDILSDPQCDSLRPYPRFRELIRNHADSNPVTMVSPKEPGEKLQLILDLGRPGQLIYAYHTDSRGAYGANAVHVRGNSGDFKHARLFAYVKTGADGRATLHTIRPMGYPEGELPQHVHFQVSPNNATRDEIWFSDDSRLTPSMRDRGRSSALIVTPERVRGGWRAIAKIELR